MLPDSPLHRLRHPAAEAAGVRLFVKRDDLYAWSPGSPLQGNKVRKLSHLLSAPGLAGSRVVSFGGAYSNHVAALSAAGARFGFPTRFFIRGEHVRNPVLDFAAAYGSELTFLSRADYRRKSDPLFLKSLGITPTETLIPEGGTSRKMLPDAGKVFLETCAQLGAPPDHFCLSAGTGGTAAAVVQAASGTGTQIEVFPALRGDWMRSEILGLLSPDPGRPPLSIYPEYAGRGYARFDRRWKLSTPPGAMALRADIGEPGLPPLEPVYTAKLFTGLLDRLRRGAYASGSTVVALHTGGIY